MINIKPTFEPIGYIPIIADVEDYIINEQGDIISFKRSQPRKLVRSIDKDGYIKVNITSKDGKNRRTFLHRLIAQTFIPNPENKSQVNHIDGIKTNNSINNLEWCTSKENVIHAVKTKLRIANYGSAHGISKLTEANILEIRAKYIPRQYTLLSLANEYNVSFQTISEIVNRQTWKHI